MKKIILILIVAMSFTACKKENQCNSSCYVVIKNSFRNDTISANSSDSSICSYYDFLMKQYYPTSDASGNTLNKSDIKLVCP